MNCLSTKTLRELKKKMGQSPWASVWSCDLLRKKKDGINPSAFLGGAVAHKSMKRNGSCCAVAAASVPFFGDA